jgi:radical SAM protein with 4Fe4S-binding SPASM domain
MSLWGHVYQKALMELVPIGVHFDLTYRCHHRCYHCYIPREWRQGHGPGPELSTAQIKDILEQLASAGTFFLSFSGGEIFLREDLFEVLEYARKLNFAITLFTSGTKGLSLKELNFLTDLGIEVLLVSFFSLDAKVHDAITGIPGSWLKVWRLLNHCLEINLRVGLNAPVLAANSPEIPALQDFAREKKIILRLDSDIVPGWEPNSPCFATDLQDTFNRFKLRRCKNPVDHPLKDMKMVGCGAGLISCYITPQGDIWPCVDVSWNCGNILRDGDFSHIWRESPGLKNIRLLQQEMGQIHKRMCEVNRQPQNYQDLKKEELL